MSRFVFLVVQCVCSLDRLLAGGQDLRAGDPRCALIATQHNCCVFCLQRGSRTAETLAHVTFCCPAYAQLRAPSSVVGRALRNADTRVFALHRGEWSFPQLRQLRQFFMDLLLARTSLAGGRQSKVRKVLDELAQVHWQPDDARSCSSSPSGSDSSLQL